MEDAFLKQQLEREIALAEVERARRLRKLEEEHTQLAQEVRCDMLRFDTMRSMPDDDAVGSCNNDRHQCHHHTQYTLTRAKEAEAKRQQELLTVQVRKRKGDREVTTCFHDF